MAFDETIFERGMTNEEAAIRGQLQEFLLDHGCPTYAKLLGLMDLQVLPPDILGGEKYIAFMRPDDGIICVNEQFINDARNPVELIALTLKHEILHEWRDHEKRLISKLAKEMNIDLGAIHNDADLIKAVDDIRRIMYGDKNKFFNIAGDLEISNVAYDDEDKLLMKKIYLGDDVLSALVTENNPRWKKWINDDMETMYDKLRELEKKTVRGQMAINDDGSLVFVDAPNEVIYGRK